MTVSAAAPRPEGPATGVAGFYGKMPAKGDFVARRLPHSFVEPWDLWLQAALEVSRAQLGEAWLDAYLHGPVWRFVVPEGQCGNLAMAGVIVPSVDRVGRYFPMTVAAPLPANMLPIDVPRLAADWFELVEELALSVLDDDFNFDAFDRTVEDAGPLPGNKDHTSAGTTPPAAIAGRLPAGVRQAIGPDGDPWPTFPHLLHSVLTAAMGRYGLWWTAGSPRLEGSLLVCPTLPAPDRFAALLDGDWSRWGWQSSVADAAALGEAGDV